MIWKTEAKADKTDKVVVCGFLILTYQMQNSKGSLINYLPIVSLIGVMNVHRNLVGILCKSSGKTSVKVWKKQCKRETKKNDYT